MQPLQAPRGDLAVGQDVSYGEDPLQKLDIYAPKGAAAAPRPIVIFVHGGGFTGGDKRVVNNVASYFARHGMVGAAMNFRLAPAATWPAQSLDIGKAVAWLNANAAQYGGDPRRIILIGYSSGAATVASYIFDQSIQTSRDGVVGAVLMSGRRLHGQQSCLLRRRSGAGRRAAASRACQREQASGTSDDGRVRSANDRRRDA
jgi:acetyl esterase/lipase